MTTRATCTFEITGWEAVEYDDQDGVKLTRTGSFVLVHDASMSSDGQSLSLTIMRDSGTGDLQGIGGQGNIIIDADGGHTLTLDYDLG